MAFSAILLDCDGTIVPYIELLHREIFEEAIVHFHRMAGISFDKNLFTTVWDKNLGTGAAVFFSDD